LLSNGLHLALVRFATIVPFVTTTRVEFTVVGATMYEVVERVFQTSAAMAL